jgi:HK97 family phage major capsid protein
MSDPTKLILDKLAEQDKKLDSQAAKLADLEKKAAEPRKGLRPGQLFHATSGPVGQDSQPYSLMKMAAHAMGWLDADQVKNELAIGKQLREWYNKSGFNSICRHPASIVVPFSTAHMPPPEDTATENLLTTTKQMVNGHSQAAFDPEEAEWVNKKMGGHFTKALGTIADSTGGVLVGFPTLGELIELQRNMEVFPQAGASEVALPPNGRIQYPKQTGGSTANWIGEAAANTESTPATGYLDLVAKKLGIFVKLNNELLRFTSPTTEALVRTDMSRQGALKIDLAMLEGTGGTQIKGLITYDSQSSWTQGTDKLIAYTVTSNLFQPNDPADMEAVMPDEAGTPTAWIMRRDMWAKIRNRRNDAVTTADAKGPFVFNITREAKMGLPLELEGVKVVRSSQVSNTRSSTKTYVILGFFPDWLIGRFGVMEFLPTNVSDTAFQNDQTWLRGIQHIDAGARHAASFVFADAITIS